MNSSTPDAGHVDIPSEGGATIGEAIDQVAALVAGGRLDAADSLSRQIGSECAPALFAIGALAIARGEFLRASYLFLAAEQLVPPSAEYALGVARALFGLGDFKGCIERARAALELSPALHAAQEVLGDAHFCAWEYAEAVPILEGILLRTPGRGNVWNSLGLAKMHTGDVSGSIVAFRRAIELCGEISEPWLNLGIALRSYGELSEGLEAIRHAVELAPTGTSNNTAYLFALTESLELTAVEIAEAHKRWGASLVKRTAEAPRLYGVTPDPERRIKVGYVSPDFRGHSVAFFVTPFLTLHDRSKVYVHCYANQARGDATTLQLRRHADCWTDVTRLDDGAFAEQVRRDQIDILVDLAGLTSGNRLGVFARKPAPVQVTYLGYPATSGIPTIQYRISDRWADPPGETEHLHSEELLRPFDSFLCYAPPVGCPPVSAPPVLHTGRITFGSFNRIRKITRMVISMWAQILSRVPESRLLLKPGPADRARLLDLFTQHGVNSERVEFLDYTHGVVKHLEQYAMVDIAVDTFPYNGTTTTCEALWMGVPVVTLAGSDHRSRVGLSLLQNVGLTHLIARTPDEYVRIAADLAQDHRALTDLRDAQRGRMHGAPLMDAEGFTRALETAYREVWRSWCTTGRNDPPRSP